MKPVWSILPGFTPAVSFVNKCYLVWISPPPSVWFTHLHCCFILSPPADRPSPVISHISLPVSASTLDYRDIICANIGHKTGSLWFVWYDPGNICSLHNHRCLVINLLSFLFNSRFHLLSSMLAFSLFSSSSFLCLSLFPCPLLLHPPHTNPVLEYKSALGTGGHLPAMRRSKQECDHWCSSAKHLNPGTKGTQLFPKPLLQPLHLLFMDGADRKWCWRDALHLPFCYVHTEDCVLMGGQGKAEIWGKGSGRMFDLEHPRPVGAIGNAISTEVSLSQDYAAAHGQPSQVSKQLKLMSEICRLETKMFFQAPAGCSTITALPQL